MELDIVYGLLGNLFALARPLASFRFAISVLVVLVSHKVYFLCSTISLAVLFVIYKKVIFCRKLVFAKRNNG